MSAPFCRPFGNFGLPDQKICVSCTGSRARIAPSQTIAPSPAARFASIHIVIFCRFLFPRIPLAPDSNVAPIILGPSAGAGAPACRAAGVICRATHPAHSRTRPDGLSSWLNGHDDDRHTSSADAARRPHRPARRPACDRRDGRVPAARREGAAVDGRGSVLRAERAADHRHPARPQGARPAAVPPFLPAARAAHPALVCAAAAGLHAAVRRRLARALALVRVVLDQHRAVARQHRPREPERALVARGGGAVLHFLAVRGAALPRAPARLGGRCAGDRRARAARDRDAVVRLVLADLLPHPVPHGSARGRRAARRGAAPRPPRARTVYRRGGGGGLPRARAARLAASVESALSRRQHAAVERGALQHLARALHLDRGDRAARARPRAARADASGAGLRRHHQLHGLSHPPERAVRALVMASEPLRERRARARHHARLRDAHLVRLRTAPHALCARAVAAGRAPAFHSLHQDPL